jgi:hypothetical protein
VRASPLLAISYERPTSPIRAACFRQPTRQTVTKAAIIAQVVAQFLCQNAQVEGPLQVDRVNAITIVAEVQSLGRGSLPTRY